MKYKVGDVAYFSDHDTTWGFYPRYSGKLCKIIKIINDQLFIEFFEHVDSQPPLWAFEEELLTEDELMIKEIIE